MIVSIKMQLSEILKTQSNVLEDNIFAINNNDNKELTAFFLKEYPCFHLQVCALNSNPFLIGDTNTEESCLSEHGLFSLFFRLTSLLDWVSISNWPTVAKTEQKRDVAMIRANAEVCTLPLINTVVSSRTAFT